MIESIEFKKTNKQIEATAILASKARHVMCFGGSRSGKTAIILRAIIIRAMKEKSRHLIVRDIFNHARTSIWLDSLPKILKMCFPSLKCKLSKTDYYVTLPNGSEIWVSGLDDSERVEKILGREYSTIFFNECSKIDYSSVQIALTRLAEKNGLMKRAYYDENPPTKRHWSYWLFIKHLDPADNVPIDAENYASILMNPSDNSENIDSEYITEILDKLPEKQRLRFKEGQFTDDDDGCAYYEFNRERHVRSVEREPGTIMVGMDFNVNPMTAILFQVINNRMQVFDEVFLNNSDTYKMASALGEKNAKGARVFPDSTGANRKTSGISDHVILREAGFIIEPTRNPIVFDRVNNVNRLLKEDRIIIDPKCKRLINDLEKVSWKNNELDQKSDIELTHISDALGYPAWKLFPLRPSSQKSSQVNL